MTSGYIPVLRVAKRVSKKPVDPTKKMSERQTKAGNQITLSLSLTISLFLTLTLIQSLIQSLLTC